MDLWDKFGYRFLFKIARRLLYFLDTENCPLVNVQKDTKVIQSAIERGHWRGAGAIEHSAHFFRT